MILTGPTILRAGKARCIHPMPGTRGHQRRSDDFDSGRTYPFQQCSDGPRTWYRVYPTEKTYGWFEAIPQVEFVRHFNVAEVTHRKGVASSHAE